MFQSRTRRAFSLIELVIVVVIIGIIAAIAIPRMSRGTTGASDSNLVANLRVLRNAIDLFYTEHGNTYPLVARFEAQMTTYTDSSGGINPTKDSTYIYGPYIREIPALPVGANRGAKSVAAGAGAGVGWIYTESTGEIVANASESDATGKPYKNY